MKIERKYKDIGADWEEVTEEEFIRRVEWAGYRVKGTAVAALQEEGKIETPWAWFRVKKEVEA